MRKFGAWLSLACLAGCSLEPAYHRPSPVIPPSWPAGSAELRASEAQLATVTYEQIFRDPKLQAVIAQALTNAQDLRIALANVESARAQYRVSHAEIFPEIDATGRIATGRSSREGGSIGGTATGGTTSTGDGGTSGTRTSYSLGIGTTSFEVDLFGRLRSLSNAAFDEYLGTEAGLRAARLTLVANVANAYYTLASDRSLLAVARDTAASAAKSVELTRARLVGGIAPRTDLRQAETVFAQAQADQASLTAVVSQDRNALELLVGATVADANLPTLVEDVDSLVSELPAGLDSSILLRRPDVLQAEYQLRAANARIGAARAAFFPTLSLTSLAGLASTSLSSLFTGGAFTWSVAPSATLPIFDEGRNRGNLAYARAQRDLAIANYQKTIQTAFREISDALARRATIGEEFNADLSLEEAARDTLLLNEARYRQGIDPYLNTLDAQRTLYGARRTLIIARLVRVQNLISLYQTLGGDQRIDHLP